MAELADERSVWEGRFYRFGPVTMLPRPYQEPHPPIHVAAAFSPESCRAAGERGYGLLTVPSISSTERVQEMLEHYRESCAEAGHEPGTEPIQMSYNCHVDEDREQALRMGRVHAENYTGKLAQAAAAWSGTKSDQYAGYARLVEAVKSSDYSAQLAANKVLAGTPDDVAAQLATIEEWFGDITVSLQINSGDTPLEDAERTLRLFAKAVAPGQPDGPDA